MGTPGGKTKAGDWQARKITLNMFLSFPFLCHKSLLTKLSRAHEIEKHESCLRFAPWFRRPV